MERSAPTQNRLSGIVVALIISLLLHLLVIVVISFLQTDFLHHFVQDVPLVPPSREKPLVFELVETPDVPSSPPEQPTDLASDTATSARDAVDKQLPISDTPYAEGTASTRDVTAPAKPENQPRAEPSSATAAVEGQGKETATPAEQQPVVIPQMLASNQQSFRNLRSEVASRGGMMLNTYQWKYAPYLLKLKRRISGNLRPPYAFTRLGIIGGQNLIRFRINPDGAIVNVTLLWSNSHESLEQSSIAAIEKSHPFLPLPAGFPKEYLEITALFTYNNKPPTEGRK